MMKSSLSISAVVLFLALSCIRPADFETDITAVVVNCILCYPYDVQELTLSYSVPNGKKTNEPINQATISLFDQTAGELAGFFVPIGDGKWQSQISVQPAHEYKLDIDIDGKEHISSITTVPESQTIQYFQNGEVTWTDDFVKNSLIHEKVSTEYDFSAIGNSIWMYILNYDVSAGKHVISDRIATSNRHVDEFNRSGEALTLDEEWKVHAYKHNGAYYNKFLHFVQRDGLEMSKTTLIAGDMSEPFYSSFDSSPTNQSGQSPSACFGEPSTMPVDKMGYVVLVSVSDDYDIYLKDIILRKMKEEGHDVTVLYDKEHIFTNINGGVGIFGAKLTYYLPWEDRLSYTH